MSLAASMASVAPRPDEELGFWLRPGVLFWLAIAAGLAIRVYLVVFTHGTYDVGIWEGHAAGIQEHGLTAYYRANTWMNHPPFIAVVVSWLWKLGQAIDVPFRILLRAPFALLDAGTALLLLCAFRDSRYRFALAAGYWLHPLSLIFSAYHGNTDSAIAFLLLLSVLSLQQRRIVLAAAALGLSLWIKLPALLVAPAFVFFLPRWRERLTFLLVAGGVGLSTYLPALAVDPAAVIQGVLGYRGQMLQTPSGIPIWGMHVFLPWLAYLPDRTRFVDVPIQLVLDRNVWFTVVPVVLFAYLRRAARSGPELGRTVAGSYAMLYGFSIYWAFQYFTWSVPFWFFCRARFAVPASLLAGGYVYALYAFVCGDPWLLGAWDFRGRAEWPAALVGTRSLAVLFFFFSALGFLAQALAAELRARRASRPPEA